MKNTKQTLNELLVELFNHILYLEERNLKDKGVTLSMNEVHVLENIQKSKSNTMSDIAKRLMVTVGTLTVSVDRLVRKGYVRRYKDESDKRLVLLELTEMGKSVLAIHDRFHEEMIDVLISDLGLDQDKMLLEALERISFFFKNQYAD